MDSVSGSTNSPTKRLAPSNGTLSSLNTDTRENNQLSLKGVIQPRGFPSLPEHWLASSVTTPSEDGSLQLFTMTLHAEPWEAPRVLLAFHGLGEYGGRYLHFPHFLKGVVNAVICPDHRGHGRSEGLRGHVEDFDDYVNDAIASVRRLDERLRTRFGSSEIHLLGHSMGGLIALRALLADTDLPVRSAIISAPLLGIKMPVPPLKRAAAKVISMIWGSFQLASDLDVTQLSHDENVQEAYLSDELVHTKLTPSAFFALEKAMTDTRTSSDRSKTIRAPMLMLVPLSDQIVDPDPSLQFYSSIHCTGKKLVTLPGFRHEPFNEGRVSLGSNEVDGKAMAFAEAAKWIQGH